MDAGLKRELEEKVYTGVRLGRADGEALYASDDLTWLGRLAHHRRSELNGERVTFSRAGQRPLVVDTAGGVVETWGPAAGLWYGDGTRPKHLVDQVLWLRDRQDETGLFQALVPMCQPSASAAAPVESLRTFAVSRLLLDNVPHLTCSWAVHELSVAQLSLYFGVDDLDSSTADGARTADAGIAGGMSQDDVATLIGEAGFQPVERDTGYSVVHEYPAPPSLAERRAEPQRVWA
jgi:aminodeoxyfutalosine synthase